MLVISFDNDAIPPFQTTNHPLTKQISSYFLFTLASRLVAAILHSRQTMRPSGGSDARDITVLTVTLLFISLFCC